MTVTELIEKLGEFPGTLKVVFDDNEHAESDIRDVQVYTWPNGEKQVELYP